MNGVRDPGETGVNGAVVTISGLGIRTTNSSGNYSFSSVPSGTWSVELTTMPQGFITSTDNPVRTTVGPNSVVNFGITNHLDCQDAIDNNGNGLIDACDPGCDINGRIDVAYGNCNDNPDYDPLDPSENKTCSDNINNDATQGADAGDSDCHTDGNPGNPSSYVPDFPSEAPIPPLCDGITPSQTVGAGETLDLIVKSCVSLTQPTFSWNPPSEGSITPGTTTPTGTAVYDSTATYNAPESSCSSSPITLRVNVSNPNGTTSYSKDITVSPRNVLSGIVLEDTQGNNCQSGATPYGTGAIITVYNSGGSPTASDTTDGAGTYLAEDTTACGNKSAVISAIPGYHINAVRFDGGSWSTTGFTGFTYGPFNFSQNHTLDFCISDVTPWFQTTTGDVRMNSLVNRVPQGQYASEDPQNPSIFYSSNFPAEFGKGSASSLGWKINDEYSYHGDSRNRNGSMSYSFYQNRIAQQNVEVRNIPGCSEGDCTVGISGLQTGAYLLQGGNLTITSYSHLAGARVLLLVSGNVNIRSNIPVPTGSLLIIAAKGNITIDRTIGTTDPSNKSPQINGILTSEGSIILDGTSCESGSPDRRLNVAGSLIANSLKPFQVGGAGSLVNNRSLCVSDRNYPVLYITPRYDFITQLTDFYKTSYTRWRELAP